ncbi:hypothetical protein GA0070616_0956 [Micromonospora nigra]|uniref:Uncharacterized protein n=1 Tax=Micromonospora nigra TaxID=145857 RepID=A0A1C6RGA5_9ACTN|nr:hypothetical protein GA0070616_0956 [Micromonospora nigra]
MAGHPAVHPVDLKASAEGESLPREWGLRATPVPAARRVLPVGGR